MVFMFYLLHRVASKYPDIKSISVSVLSFVYIYKMCVNRVRRGKNEMECAKTSKLYRDLMLQLCCFQDACYISMSVS